MEDDGIHPVIRLLAARKESNPEEFDLLMKDGWTTPQENGRWGSELNTLGWYMNDAEKALIYGTRRDIVFNSIMGRVMSKLLRGTN